MLVAFLLCFGLHVLYTAWMGWGWHRARQKDPSRPRTEGEEGKRETGGDDPGLSVIVAVRNEETVLPALLDALGRQTHTPMEVILVNDASTDGTADLLASWAEGHAERRVVTVTEPSPPRKKNALRKGIEAARFDRLAFTDADCTPPPRWAAALVRAHDATDVPTVLVGYSPFRHGASGLLGVVSRYETFVAGLYTAAATGLDRPYMAVGRNLSYPRSVFDAAGGFDDAYMSGDDDLFIQAVHRGTDAPVRAVLTSETHVPTAAPKTWRAWVRQKQRHLSAGTAYPWGVGMHLTIMHIAAAGLWLAPLVLGTTGAGLLAAGLLIRHAVLGPASDVLDETDLMPGFPLGELAYLLYLVVLTPLGLFRAPGRW